MYGTPGQKSFAFQWPPCKYTDVEADLLKTQIYYLPACIVLCCVTTFHVSPNGHLKSTQKQIFGLVETHTHCLLHCSLFCGELILTYVVLQLNLPMHVLVYYFFLMHLHFDQWVVGSTPF